MKSQSLPNPNYEISSHSYLERAKNCLEYDELRYLFYAAFELRCCIESRQNEYLEAQKRYRRSLGRPWQVERKARELDRIFHQEKIVKVSVTKGQEVLLTVYHLPINKKLEKNVGKLGAYLHAAESKPNSEAWWHDLRNLLLDTYRAAWIVCQGQLLCPPFFHKDGTVPLTLEVEKGFENSKAFSHLSQVGDEVLIHVEYPREPPNGWRCDL